MAVTSVQTCRDHFPRVMLAVLEEEEARATSVATRATLIVTRVATLEVIEEVTLVGTPETTVVAVREETLVATVVVVAMIILAAILEIAHQVTIL